MKLHKHNIMYNKYSKKSYPIIFENKDYIITRHHDSLGIFEVYHNRTNTLKDKSYICI